MTASLLTEVRARLASPANPRSPAIRKMAAELYGNIKHWPLAERNRFCNELWKGGTVEEGTLAIYLYQRFQKECAACEFHLFEKWIERFVHNWGHCDGVAHYLIAAAIENEPALAALLPPWTASANRWKRRAAAVSLVRGARRGVHSTLALDVAERLLGDGDDLVRKGVGWLLKETYAAKPGDVVRFLGARKGGAPRIVLRISAEKMSPPDRATVLGL